jgi:hypothetical protein
MCAFAQGANIPTSKQAQRKRRKDMTTATVQRSQNFNLELIISQPCNFEEALHSALEEVGERFGLYDIMVQDGPITAPCLATQAGIPVQATRVWLDAQTDGGYLKHYPTAGLYSLWWSWPRRTSAS